MQQSAPAAQQAAIFGPFFATMLLTLVVWIYMYARRIPFIVRSGLTPAELATPGLLAQRSPAAISNPSDNLKNLFEIPTLFYALSLYLFATGQVDDVFHSAMHCTANVVMVRFYLYLISTVALWLMLVRAAIGYFGG